MWWQMRMWLALWRNSRDWAVFETEWFLKRLLQPKLICDAVGKLSRTKRGRTEHQLFATPDRDRATWQ